MASELKITSRTPAVKLEAGFMLAASQLPDHLAGKLLRWGMDTYQNKSPVFNEWLGLCKGDQQVLVDYLDDDELAARRIVVTAFRRSANRAREVSASRAHARAQRGEGFDIESADPAETLISKEMGREWPDPNGHIARLSSLGMTAEEAVKSLTRWFRAYSKTEIDQALSRIHGRRIDRPGPYVEQILKNGRQHAPAQAAGESGSGHPVAVRRRVPVAPNAHWTFVGWTSKGHPRDGGTPETRKKAWRTDTGQLNYMPAENPADNPTYEQEPGIYEID